MLVKYIKVKNLLDKFGQPDYKGLNIDMFATGSQACAVDFSYCVVATREDNLPVHPDIEELTEQEYIDEREFILSTIPKPEDSVEQLRLEMAQANTELFEMMLMMSGGGV